MRSTFWALPFCWLLSRPVERRAGAKSREAGGLGCGVGKEAGYGVAGGFTPAVDRNLHDVLWQVASQFEFSAFDPLAVVGASPLAD